MAKILVTGGLGYIGSHTCVALFESGHEPVVIDNLSNSEAHVKNQIEAITNSSISLEVLDLCDFDALNRFLEKENDIAGVIHFAALKAVGESVEIPLLYYQNNIQGLINLLTAQKNAIPFIFSSSCTVYGDSDILPLKEDFPFQKAVSPYGSTKQMGEEILKFSAGKNHQGPVIALRYFNPIGAHPSSKIGELPRGIPQNLIPYLTQTAAGKRTILSVFGDTYPTHDGTCIRDYIHVMDLADAHVFALNRLLEGKNKNNFEVYNIGTGKGCTVLELIHKFEKTTGVAVPHKIAPPRAGDVTAAFADTELAETVLGWRAKRSLEEALLSAWNWEKQLP